MSALSKWIFVFIAIGAALPAAARADLKQTAVVYAWADENRKYQNSNISDPFDGGWEPFVSQINFDADLFDVAPYGGCTGQASTQTQWAGTMQYGIYSTDNSPMGAAGYQHTRYWSMVACDRTGDGDFTGDDLAVVPANSYLNQIYHYEDTQVFQTINVDTVTACTTGNCLEEIVTTMFVNLDTDCDGVLNTDLPTNPKNGNLMMCFYVEAQSPGTGSPFWGGNIQARIAAGGGEKTVNLSPVAVTAASIASFNAYNLYGRTVVEWQTASETGTAGFYLKRLNPETAEYESVNQELLPGLLSAHQGGLYRFVDDKAKPGEAVTYKLVEQEASGGAIDHGPYTVTPSEATDWPADGGYFKKAREISEAKKARFAAARDAKKQAKVFQRGLKGAAAKIAVERDGIYFVSAARIAEIFDMPIGAVRAFIGQGQLSLTSQGRKIAYQPAAGNAGLYFYGRSIDSNFTKENIYWIKKDKGQLMATVPGKVPQPAPAGQTFNDVLHLEQDAMGMPYIFSDPKADLWIWNYAMAGYLSAQFPFTAPGAVKSGTAMLTVRLKGITDADTPAEDHHAVVFVNGTQVGESSWDGMGSHDFKAAFNQAILNGKTDVIEVKGVLNNGVPYSLFGIDSFDLAYARRYEAVDNMLAAKAGGNAVISISGFSDPAVQVYDVTAPEAPRAVSATAIEAYQGGYRVNFKAASADAAYVAVGGGAVAAPVDIWADQVPALKNAKNAAEYLVIAPAQLKTGARALADYRSGQGLEAKVVDVEDIYDEFNDGMASPFAIKDFLSYAYHGWATPPRYIVLAGAGSYDYRGNLNTGDCLVPPLLQDTPYGLFAADNRYADVDGGDGIPEMAVGRLPVMTDAELMAVVDKITAYESGSRPDTIIMLADNPDPAGNFPADSNDVAAVLPANYPAEKIYLSEHTIGQARSLLQSGIGSGAKLVNYIGHGGLDRLAAEGLLTSADVPGMANAGALPVLTAMTCVAGQFSFPGYDSLGEALVLKSGGGMIAVWAPTGSSLNWAAKILNKSFFSAAFADGGTVLGDIVLSALSAYGGTDNVPVYMLDIYTLLGDPALKIN